MDELDLHGHTWPVALEVFERESGPPCRGRAPGPRSA